MYIVKGTTLWMVQILHFWDIGNRQVAELVTFEGAEPTLTTLGGPLRNLHSKYSLDVDADVALVNGIQFSQVAELLRLTGSELNQLPNLFKFGALFSLCKDADKGWPWDSFGDMPLFDILHKFRPRSALVSTACNLASTGRMLSPEAISGSSTGMCLNTITAFTILSGGVNISSVGSKRKRRSVRISLQLQRLG